MPTTRRQQAIEEGKIEAEDKPSVPGKRARRESKAHAGEGEPPKKKKQVEKKEEQKPASKRGASRKPQSKVAAKSEKPASKRGAPTKKPASKQVAKTEADVEGQDVEDTQVDASYKIGMLFSLDPGPLLLAALGTIERGHIYFFYRPKVEHEEAQSINEVKNFQMLLIPKPPAYAVDGSSDAGGAQTKSDPSMTEEAEMKVLQPGADAVPARVTRRTTKQHYRLLSIGKKRLPDPEEPSGKGKRKETFWATVTTIGDDLAKLAERLGPEEYETKTRGRSAFSR
jgi:hypothetical protein